MVKTIILGKNGLRSLSVEQFVESVFNQYSHILLTEEHITQTDKLKKYRQYDNGAEVKKELANMLTKFVNKYNSNDYIRKVDFYASKQEGLSNYIELTFNTPFGSKEWLKHMKIRVSDHPKRNDRKVDEYIHLEGKSVEDIEKELDKIIDKRIRRLQREEQLPTAQNESIRRNNNMKLRINENFNEHIVYVVWRGCYTDRSIGGIFSNVKKAEDYINELENKRLTIGEDVYIEEYEVK